MKSETKRMLLQRPASPEGASQGGVGIRYDAKRQRVAIDALAVGVVRDVLHNAGVIMEFPPAGAPARGSVSLLSYFAVLEVVDALKGQKLTVTRSEAAHLETLSEAAMEMAAAAMLAALNGSSETQLPSDMDEVSMACFYEQFSQQKVPDALPAIS